MPTTAIYNFPDIMSGDTFEARSFHVQINDDDPPSELVAVEIDFRLNRADSCATSLTLTNGNGITITNASEWRFSIDRIESLSLDAGYYVFSIKTTAADGKIRNYAQGGMMVNQPATR